MTPQKKLAETTLQLKCETELKENTSGRARERETM